MLFFFSKFLKFSKKSIDISFLFCYNVEVAEISAATSWRDGRVGLRRTTGNRVYPNRYHGFESHSLRHIPKGTLLGAFWYMARMRICAHFAERRLGSHMRLAHIRRLRGNSFPCACSQRIIYKPSAR